MCSVLVDVGGDEGDERREGVEQVSWGKVVDGFTYHSDDIMAFFQAVLSSRDVKNCLELLYKKDRSLLRLRRYLVSDVGSASWDEIRP